MSTALDREVAINSPKKRAARTQTRAACRYSAFDSGCAPNQDPRKARIVTIVLERVRANRSRADLRVRTLRQRIGCGPTAH